MTRGTIERHIKLKISQVKKKKDKRKTKRKGKGRKEGKNGEKERRERGIKGLYLLPKIYGT